MSDPVRVALRHQGRVLCVDPHPDKGYEVETRPAVGAWEVLELAKVGEGYTARFVEAGVFLCITPAGALETRPTAGAWETFQVFIVAPTPHETPIVLFRLEDGVIAGGVLLEVEVLR